MTQSFVFPVFVLLTGLGLPSCSDAFTRNNATGKSARPTFASEHENYLCLDHFGADAFPLPCKSPRDEWDFQMKDEFVITAWWPPTMNVIHEYAAAHFNMMLGGNIVAGCVENGTLPIDSTSTQALECILDQLPIIDKLGLKFNFHMTASVFNYKSTADMNVGGQDTLGGITEGLSYSYPTMPETEYIINELDRRNLSHIVAMYFLHDDDAQASGMISSNVNYLKKYAPKIPPQTNTFPDSDPEMLYATRQFVFSAEEYAIDGNTAANHVVQQVGKQLSMFSNNRYLSDRYLLDSWPLFAIGDGGDAEEGIEDLRSDSLIRLQVFSAIAYGSRGLYYYCWGHGIWNVSIPDANRDSRGEPTPNYDIVKATNADAAKFGTALLKSKHTGAILSIMAPHKILNTVPEGPGKAVEAMNGTLLVGVFSDGLNVDSGYLMLVNLESDSEPDSIPPLRVALRIAKVCSKVTFVEGGSDGYAEQFAKTREWDSKTNEIYTTMHSGGGLLVKVDGDGCGQVLRGSKPWFYDPKSISFTDGYPDKSLKAATYSAWNGDDSYDGNHLHPRAGGIVGPSSSFLIGGSAWDAGAWNPVDVSSWANAGFLAVAIDANDSSVLMNSLADATPYGLYIFAASRSSTMLSKEVLIVSQMVACHTNFAGMVLGGPTTPVSTIAESATALRSAADWTIPIVFVNGGTTAISRAVQVANAGVGLPLVSIPAAPTVRQTDATTMTQWATGLLSTLSELSKIAQNHSVPSTMGVSIDACSTDSDSALRFSAYMSIIYGAQVIWWENMGKCAPVGSTKFELISSVNKRIGNWAQALFMKPLGECVLLEAWSTSALKLPPINLNGTEIPFGAADAHKPMEDPVVVSMDPEMISLHFNCSFSPNNNQSFLFFMSTELNPALGGAPVRSVKVNLFPEIASSMPIEQDVFQGSTDTCYLKRKGNKLPLLIPGGGVQLVEYAKFDPVLVKSRLRTKTTSKLNLKYRGNSPHS